jgi:hypothetical protein
VGDWGIINGLGGFALLVQSKVVQDHLNRIVGVVLRALPYPKVLNPAFLYVYPHLLNRDFLEWTQGFLDFGHCHGHGDTVLQ